MESRNLPGAQLAIRNQRKVCGPLLRYVARKPTRALSGGTPVRIASRLSILLSVMLLTFILAPAALAAPRGGGPAHHPGQPGGPDHPEHHGPDADHRPDVGDHDRGPDGELKRAPGPARERRARRRCARRERPGVPGDCDYYYDDDDESSDWAPADSPTPEAASPGAAKIAPLPRPDGNVESYAPSASKELEEQLTSARRNWLQKKSDLDDANGARARAEYQALQTGSPVDPAIIARQDKAKAEASAAHAALAPLVEQAREAGMSPELLDLYNRSNAPD